jgi:hypothetical protein
VAKKTEQRLEATDDGIVCILTQDEGLLYLSILLTWLAGATNDL